jgi:Tol biopolymer transport system component
MIGSKLAHYEITTHLGSGGMGEVYQATDAKLGRSVAIKLLPEAFARDAERIGRFEREARLLAALNHPNIAAIHGLEESGGRHFLVMELVDGETIADRICRGPIRIDEALAIAKQMAEALEAAHEKGIVHRDLKPANVKMTSGGAVKVLDFGLAKMFQEEPAEANRSNSPTLSLAATNAGVILGTAAYMSPEQAKGQNADKRADIFAFGSVLYEMLTGRQVFPGDTVSEILARVIEREPDWNVLPAGLHPRILELLRRCLEKDPKKRRRDIGDVRMEIELALADPDRGAPVARPVTTGRGIWLGWTVAAVMTVAFAGAFVALYFREPAVAPAMRVDIVTPATSDLISFAISPDGKRLVFVAESDGQPRLWLRPLESVTAQPLPATEGASYPFWSRDSRSVGFFAGGKLKRLDIGEGLPRTLADVPIGRGGAWSPAGIILFASSPGGLVRIPASGGEALAVTKLQTPHQISHRFPHFLPDGRRFLFYVTGSTDASGIFLGSLESPESTRLTAADTPGFYLEPGWLLYIRQGTLVARRFDVARGEISGDPLTVADAVGFDANVNAGAFSVSATGSIAYRAGGASRRRLEWFDRSGKPIGNLGAPDESNLLNPNFSPDGRRLAVDRTVEGNTDIWILDATRMTRFTFDGSVDHIPIWSPDGTQVAFDSARKAGIHDLYVKPSSSAGNEEPLFESPLGKGILDWSSDARSILFAIQDPKTNFDLWVLPLEGDRIPWVYLNTPFDERQAQFSPDGRWVAYHSNESGRYEIYVRPFPKPGGQWQISAGGGISPRWRRDGRELYYIAPDNRLMAVSISTKGATLDPAAPVALFPTRLFAGPGAFAAQYAVAPDGRFLINAAAENAAPLPITLLLNWNPVR